MGLILQKKKGKKAEEKKQLFGESPLTEVWGSDDTSSESWPFG